MASVGQKKCCISRKGLRDILRVPRRVTKRNIYCSILETSLRISCNQYIQLFARYIYFANLNITIELEHRNNNPGE